MTLTAPTRADRAVEPAAPPATRSRPPGWRNPRLLLGLVLVAASVVVGARLMAAADDSVAVWAVRHDLPAGAQITAGDVERRAVRFPDSTTADGYLSAGQDLPQGARLGREVSAGELLPRAALAGAADADLVEVPLSVAADDLPATVRQGSRVDVWVTPRLSTTAGTRSRAVQVLTDVVVVDVPTAADSLAPQETRQVIVGVPEERAASLGSALGSTSDGRVVVTRRS